MTTGAYIHYDVGASGRDGSGNYPTGSALHEAVRQKARQEQERKALRDHFAGLAMQSLILSEGSRLPNQRLAEQAYILADAMLKARQS